MIESLGEDSVNWRRTILVLTIITLFIGQSQIASAIVGNKSICLVYTLNKDAHPASFVLQVRAFVMLKTNMVSLDYSAYRDPGSGTSPICWLPGM